MTTPSMDTIVNGINLYVAAQVQAYRDNISALQTQLDTAKAENVKDDATIASLNTKIADLQAQIAAAGQSTTPALPSGWTKVSFFDDFNSNTIDLTKWNVRNNSYAKNELSIVKSANVSCSNGNLTIQARKETSTVGSTTRLYTSGYLDTIGKQSWQTGRFEMRAKLPTAKGMWPAFWLRGNAGLGEIDILEAVGGTGKTVQTVHQSTNGDMAKKGHEDSSILNLDQFHVYAVEREAGYVRWLIDEKQVFKVTNTDATWLDSTFNEPMNIRLNLQVGGSMPTWYGLNVDSTTVFPANFVIDYVRVLAR